jgi:hypothetical protein
VVVGVAEAAAAGEGLGAGEVAATAAAAAVAGERLGAGEAAGAAAGEVDAMAHGDSGLRVLGRGTRCKTLMASSCTISSSTMFKTPSFPRRARLTGEVTDVEAVE